VNGITILDIGRGHLVQYYEYLSPQGIILKYIGYDIVEDFIRVNREKFPGAHSELCDVSHDEIAQRADYAVMCQVFNERSVLYTTVRWSERPWPRPSMPPSLASP